jgi:hypothetical protein
MNRNTRSCQPQATELESKLLLSLMATPAPETAEVAILSERSGTTPAVAITNTVKGRYFAAEDNRAADAPLHVQLNDNGRVNGIGRAKLSGSLDLGGFRVAGSQDVSGTLTLSNARGTVSLRLTGSGGFAEVPNGQFVTNVSVVKGTGAYRGFQRDGTVTFQFGENQVRSIKAPSPIGGTMAVTLSLKPLVK